MKGLIFTCFIVIILMYSCKSKNKDEETKDFLPVLSFIKNQVAHVDTSLYRIILVTKENGQTDTTYLKREEFKNYAKDFINIPDITSDDLKEDYTETKLYDDGLQQVLFSYTPKEMDAEIQREDITIEPYEDTSKVSTIYIDRIVDEGDSIVHKKMLWQMDKKFQVITSVTKPGRPERVKTVEVSWW